jgi:cholesterol oxidase
MSNHQEYAEAIVIGSGFGGAIAAYHLSKAGIQTVVLERGQRWPITKTEDTFATYGHPDGRAAWLSPETVVFDRKPIDVYSGVLEKLFEEGITVLTGAGVGGGSLVYNTVLLKPSRENFEKVFPKSISYDEMEQIYYPRVFNFLKAEVIPEDVINTDYYLSTRVCWQQAQKANLPTIYLEVGSDWDIIRQEIQGIKKPAAIDGEIWYGINSGCKNSLDNNYLKQAEESGHVTIHPLHLVTDIFEHEDGGFIVGYNRIDEKGKILESKMIKCSYLFLGAGSIGTSKLLTRAKAKGTLSKLNEHIGQYWSTNGDTFAAHAVGCRTNGTKGGPATLAILDHDNPLGPQTLIVYPEYQSPEGVLNFLGMGIPSEYGYFSYDEQSEQVRLNWQPESPGNQKLLDTVNSTYSRLDAVRSGEVASQAWEMFSSHYCCPINGFPEKSLKTAAKPQTKANAGFTAHPLGGAVMGKACDFYGRVLGYSGLYVVDGALIPGSTAACNPALTIAAFAERCLDEILKFDLMRSS